MTTAPRPLRVLHCPGSVGGHPSGLVRAERDRGLDSRLVVVDPPPPGYEVDEVLGSAGRSRLGRELRRWRWVLRAARDFDVVHFNFGTSLAPSYVPVEPPEGASLLRRSLRHAYAKPLELKDLPYLRRHGVPVVVTFQGGDARQADFCRRTFEYTYVTEVGPGYDSDAYDARRRWKISVFDRYAAHIYALNPDLLWVLPARARFLPYASVDPRDWVPAARPGGKVPVLVHAPTDRVVKGTRFLSEAVARLEREGVALEYVQVEGAPRAEARAALERADLVVDQLLAGWYGGVAVEAMALAKPVVCYIRDGDLRFLPPDMRRELPVINATPSNMYEVLKEWLTTRRGDLGARGLRSRAFVERWHDPLRIAEGIKRDYELAAR